MADALFAPCGHVSKLHDTLEDFAMDFAIATVCRIIGPMPIEPDRILSILDRCCDAFTFPMLDNGYVYLAATRLSLFRAAPDWAMVIEVFGFSPRSGLPDTHI